MISDVDVDANANGNVIGDDIGKEDIGDVDVDGPPLRDLYTWTFTKAAIAPCFVRDVVAMRGEAGESSFELELLLLLLFWFLVFGRKLIFTCYGSLFFFDIGYWTSNM